MCVAVYFQSIFSIVLKVLIESLSMEIVEYGADFTGKVPLLGQFKHGTRQQRTVAWDVTYRRTWPEPF